MKMTLAVTGVWQPFQAASSGGFPAANSVETGDWKVSPTGRQECLPYEAASPIFRLNAMPPRGLHERKPPLRCVVLAKQAPAPHSGEQGAGVLCGSYCGGSCGGSRGSSWDGGDNEVGLEPRTDLASALTEKCVG